MHDTIGDGPRAEGEGNVSTDVALEIDHPEAGGEGAPVFATKLVVVLRDDLPVWQKLNATLFLVSGIAGTDPSTVGEPYEDASGTRYLPMYWTQSRLPSLPSAS
jgi:hypothetical protein